MNTSSNAIPVCEHCGNSHPNRTCTLIKAIEYHQNGGVKRIEFRDAPPIDPTILTMPFLHVFGDPS